MIHMVRRDKAAQQYLGIILIVLTSAIIYDAAPMPNDAEFKPNTKCQFESQGRSLLTPTLQDSSNEFDVLPGNAVCTGEQDLVLTCVPRSSGPVYWEFRTPTARCHSDGNMTGGNSTLTLPCDSYSVTCIVATQGQVVPSPVIYITKDYEIEEETHHCMEGEFNFVTLFCHVPMEEVMSAHWFVGGEECPPEFVSFNGLRLDLPCMPKNHQKEVSCEVEFRGGIVNKTVGFIQVNKSNSNQQVPQKVNSTNGVTSTCHPTPTAPPERDSQWTIQLSSTTLGIAILVILLVFLVTVVSAILISCWISKSWQKSLKEEQTEKMM